MRIAWTRTHSFSAIGAAIAVATFVAGVFVGEVRTRQVVEGEGTVRHLESSVPGGLADVDFQQFWDMWRTVKERYVRQPVEDKKLFYGAISGLVSSLDDPYSVYFDPDLAKSFSSELEGKFDGIGAEIGIKKDHLSIIAPLPGTPADKAGLEAGDYIVQIDAADTSDMPLDEAVSRIRGEKGTTVKLLIFRTGWKEPKEFAIVRDTILVQSVKRASAVVGKKNVSVITITHFNEDTEKAFAEAVRQSLQEGAEGIVLDLRNNPGGFLDTAVSVAGEWIHDDVVVSEQFSDGHKQDYKSDGNARLADLPTVVLVNGGSASASEIVAGALQDDGKALLVGEQTFGKGSVQDYQELDDGSALKLTIALWLTPKGRSIDKQGIAPDIKVERTEEDYQKDRDPQYDKALRLLFEPRTTPAPASPTAP